MTPPRADGQPVTTRRVLIITACSATAGALPAFLLGSQAVQITRDLAFGDALLGLAVAISWLTAAAASAPMGRVSERLGGGRSLRAAVILNAGVMGLVALVAVNWAILAVLLAVGGIGNALAQPSANLVMVHAIPQERHGFAFAVKQSAIPFATLLGGLVVPAVTLTLGWRYAYALGALAALVVAGAVPGNLDRRAAEVRAVGQSARTSAGLDSPLRVLAGLAIGIGLGAAAAGALTAFLVSGAVEAGLSEATAGLLLMGGSAIGIASRLIAGARADTRGGGHLRVVSWMLVGGAMAYLAMALGTPTSYVVATPLAFAAGWAWPGLFNLAIVRANPRAAGIATSITQTGTYVGAGLGPLGFGLLASRVGYGWGWLVTAVTALAAAQAIVMGRARLRRAVVR
jgi:predicted MFS family arabinose efflux permease